MALASVINTGSLVAPFNATLAEERGELRGVSRSSLQRTRRLYRRNVRWNSRRLRRSGRIVMAADGMSGTLTIDPPGPKGFPNWEEEGTRPHEIRPRNKKALRFKGMGGEVQFAKVVRHPGTPPSHAMRRAETVARRLLPDDIRRVTSKRREF